MSTNVSFEDWRAGKLQDPEIRSAFEALEPAYQIARLRMQRGLTQAQLAKRLGTTQSSIARLESGRREPSLSFLRRVVKALGGHLEVQIVAQEEAVAEQEALLASTVELCADVETATVHPCPDREVTVGRISTSTGSISCDSGAATVPILVGAAP